MSSRMPTGIDVIETARRKVAAQRIAVRSLEPKVLDMGHQWGVIFELVGLEEAEALPSIVIVGVDKVTGEAEILPAL